MSARNGLTETRNALRPADRLKHDLAARGHGIVFISAADLKIVSTALAQFIVASGKRVWDDPERAEVTRAREMMDCVDDELYTLSRTK